MSATVILLFAQIVLGGGAPRTTRNPAPGDTVPVPSRADAIRPDTSAVSVLLPDKPGELVRVSQVIADKRGNVIKLDHNQFFSTNRSAAVELKITLEAFGTEHKKEIIQALEEAGYKPKQIRPNL